MSSLLVLPVEHADIPTYIQVCISTFGSIPIGRPPAYPGFASNEEASVRADLCAPNSHIHHLKVVDTANANQIIAYAKWEIYEHGRPDLEKLREPLSEAEMNVDEFGKLREIATRYFRRCNAGMAEVPHLKCSLLVTDRQHRRRGAGSLLVRWGVEMAEAMGLPCYLLATEEGRSLYRKHGFEDIDTAEFNLSEYGLAGVETRTEMLRKPSMRTNDLEHHSRSGGGERQAVDSTETRK